MVLTDPRRVRESDNICQSEVFISSSIEDSVTQEYRPTLFQVVVRVHTLDTHVKHTPRCTSLQRLVYTVSNTNAFSSANVSSSFDREWGRGVRNIVLCHRGGWTGRRTRGNRQKFNFGKYLMRRKRHSRRTPHTYKVGIRPCWFPREAPAGIMAAPNTHSGIYFSRKNEMRIFMRPDQPHGRSSYSGARCAEGFLWALLFLQLFPSSSGIVYS